MNAILCDQCKKVIQDRPSFRVEEADDFQLDLKPRDLCSARCLIDWALAREGHVKDARIVVAAGA